MVHTMNVPTCFCGSTRNMLLIEGDWSYIKVKGQAVHFRALKCLDCDLVSHRSATDY